MDKSKQHLEYCKDQIEKFLKNELKLELHPDKTEISPIYHGTPFLGFRVYYFHKLPKKSNIRNFMRIFEEFRSMHEQGLISRENIVESVDGWCVYASHGNTHGLRNKISTQTI